MIWLLVPHDLAEVALVDLLAADRAWVNSIVPVLRLVWLAGLRRSKVGYSGHARTNTFRGKSSVSCSSQLVKDIAPKAIVIWSTVEMSLQSALRHGGRRFQPVEIDRRLSGLISVHARRGGIAAHLFRLAGRTSSNRNGVFRHSFIYSWFLIHMASNAFTRIWFALSRLRRATNGN
ncbi:hypothetical protein, partial [Mesorhizobium sp. M0589]|uniref:hypothetical protein n=1 Tax=Mesorhizobium sp. M0589 TaxID=2956965 RepID=UPI00333AE0AA